MAGMDGYDVDVSGARATLARTESIWSDLYGIEKRIQSDFNEAGSAAKCASKVKAALDNAFTGCIHPMVVTNVNSGMKTIDGGHSVLNAISLGASAIAAKAAHAEHDAAAKKAVKALNGAADYTPDSTTGRPLSGVAPTGRVSTRQSKVPGGI